jgi:nucleoside-diphosphate-sugar epimerase
MEAFVTGSSGVLGQSLLPQLAARGDRLHLFDMVPVAEDVKVDLRGVARDGAAIVAETLADMRDPAALCSAMAGSEVVYHLAAGQRMKPQFADLSEEEIFTMNLAGVQNVLDAINDSAPRLPGFGVGRPKGVDNNQSKGCPAA